MMPQGIVDLPEPVQVHQKKCHRFLLPSTPRNGLQNTDMEKSSVRKPRYGIVKG